MTKVNNLVVVGAGTMGRGIAQWFVQQGVNVQLVDESTDVLGKALDSLHASWDKLLAKGKFSEDETENFKDLLVCATLADVHTSETDLVIEAIVEDEDIKRKVFTHLDEIFPASTIFASNTSSLPLSLLAKAVTAKRRERFLGLHFFNPAPIMKLVEVIRGEKTQDSIADSLANWLEEHGKVTALCQDRPGFIVNRVARNFYGEALRIAERDDEATFREIDNTLTECGGFRMGPFTLMDLIGVDVNYHVTHSVWKAFFYEERFAPHYLQQKLVQGDRLGRKTNKGFYTYE